MANLYDDMDGDINILRISHCQNHVDMWHLQKCQLKE